MKLYLLAAVFCPLVLAQVYPTNIAKIAPTTATVAGLPTAPATGRVVIVSDGSSATDCTVGGGSTKVWCRWSGAAWQAVGLAAGKVSAAVSTLTSTASAAATIYFAGITLDQATYLTSGKVLHAHVGGTHTTSGAAPPTATLGWALCSVSGCGSGTVINLGFASFAPFASNATEMPWSVDMLFEFQSTTIVQSVGRLSFASAAPAISGSNSQAATTIKNFGTLTAGLTISALTTGNWFLTPYFGYTNVANTATFSANVTTVETIN